jgi:hypothetical protein
MDWDLERILEVLEPEQRQWLYKHAKETGQPIEESVAEALTDWIDSVNARRSGIERHNRN